MKWTEEELASVFREWADADWKLRQAQRALDQAEKVVASARAALDKCMEAERAAHAKVEATIIAGPQEEDDADDIDMSGGGNASPSRSVPAVMHARRGGPLAPSQEGADHE